MKKNDDILNKLTLSEKIRLTSGAGFCNTYEIPKKNLSKITMLDGPHGVKTGTEENIVFPNLCLLACSFDRKNAETAGALIGNECAKYNVDVLLAPGINLKRTPVGGRNFEYFSEDEHLSGELATAYINGVQKNGTSATVKHFCCNNQDNYRMSADSVVDEKTLFNTYLKQFYKVIKKSSPDCVMTSYNKVNGEKSNESEFLQKQVLRKKFGFKGVIMSDWGAVTDKITATKTGCDLEMPGGADYSKELTRALKKGLIKTEDINGAAERILNLVKKHEKKSNYFKVDEKAVLSDIVSESIVMLKNDGVLPLNKSEKIGVFGTTARFPVYQGGGCAKVVSGRTSIPLDLLKAEYDVVYVEDINDIDKLKNCDKILVFAKANCLNSEGYDRADIAICDEDLTAANKIYAFNKNTCVIMQNGGVVDFAALNAGAILECYYGGNYFADGLMQILNGKSPSGRLAETFPVCIENAPSCLSMGVPDKIVYAEGDYIGYKYYVKKKIPVLYPFGFGLSYADIKYNSFTLDCNKVSVKSSVFGKIELENASEISAKEVIQIYFDNGKIKKLVYFDKISLLPKEKKTVGFKIDNFEFASYDGFKYSLLNESGKLILARNAEEDIFAREICIIPEKKQKITKDSLVEDVYKNYGLEIVKKYFNKPFGLALYGDPARVFEYNEEYFLKDDFERSVILMMPLKNLVGFSLGQYTDADLTRDVKEINSLN